MCAFVFARLCVLSQRRNAHLIEYRLHINLPCNCTQAHNADPDPRLSNPSNPYPPPFTSAVVQRVSLSTSPCGSVPQISLLIHVLAPGIHHRCVYVQGKRYDRGQNYHQVQCNRIIKKLCTKQTASLDLAQTGLFCQQSHNEPAAVLLPRYLDDNKYARQGRGSVHM